MDKPKSTKITYVYDFEDMLTMGKRLLDDGYNMSVERVDHDWYQFIYQKDEADLEVEEKYVFEYIRP